MRPSNQRRNRFLEAGVIMLVAELMSVGYDAIPPVTLATIAGQVLLYIGVIDVPWDKWDVCISGYKVLEKRDFRALIFSSFEHGDDMHLYYNMVSFLVKGRTLEYKYGSANFALLLGIITMMTSGLYVALAWAGAATIADEDIMSSCAIGFSGVIFALKFITTVEDSGGHRRIYGFLVPTKYATWVELIAIHVLVPNASFMGHFAGILAGVLYTKTFIGGIIDSVLHQVTGYRITHGRQPSARYYSRSRNSSNFNPGFNFFDFFRHPSRAYYGSHYS